MPRLTCATLWIGERLGPVERACLRSVLRQGHPLALYCYRRPEGVPEGVEVRDAAEVLPEASVVRHRNGSPALFANRFRYELQRRGAGAWVDTDVYLVAPLPDARPYLLGREDGRFLGNAVLRLPPDAPVLAELLALFAERRVPPWLSPRERLRAWARLARTGRTGIAEMPWGTLGPRAVTAVLHRAGLDGWALPQDVLYPVGCDDAAWVLDPDVLLEARTTPRTVAVHLWNEKIKRVKDAPAPPGSFLARLQAEGAEDSERLDPAA